MSNLPSTIDINHGWEDTKNSTYDANHVWDRKSKNTTLLRFPQKSPRSILRKSSVKDGVWCLVCTITGNSHNTSFIYISADC